MSKEEELKKKAEASWEGCHGCNESDRDMWINGYIKGALANPIELPTDDEIEKESEKILYVELLSFREGAKWVVNKIKGDNNE